jgi:predicted  nucleic acid-binding Zn-ribbon protein
MDDNQNPEGSDSKANEPVAQNPQTPSDNGKQQTPKPDNIDGLIAKKDELLSEVKSERQKRQELEQKLAEIEALNAAKERAEAEKKGEFEKLYKDADEKLKNYETRVKTYEEKLAATLKNELDSLSDTAKKTFEKMFGDIADVSVRLEKLSIYKQTIGNPSAAIEQAPAKAVDEAKNKQIVVEKLLSERDFEAIKKVDPKTMW